MSHRKKVDAANSRIIRLQVAIWKEAGKAYGMSGGDFNVPFRDALAACSSATREKYSAAIESRDEAERLAIAAGKAWRATFGAVYFYR